MQAFLETQRSEGSSLNARLLHRHPFYYEPMLVEEARQSMRAIRSKSGIHRSQSYAERQVSNVTRLDLFLEEKPRACVMKGHDRCHY